MKKGYFPKDDASWNKPAKYICPECHKRDTSSRGFALKTWWCEDKDGNKYCTFDDTKLKPLDILSPKEREEMKNENT